MTVVHLALVASVIVYGTLLLFLHGRLEPVPRPRPGAEWGLLLLGLLEYLAVVSWTRARLSSGRGEPRERVRSLFILRAAAAEALGVFGLVLGLTGARPAWSAGLLGASLLALAASAPTRDAWASALRQASAGTGSSPG